MDEAKKAAKTAAVVALRAGLVTTESADQSDANMLNDQIRCGFGIANTLRQAADLHYAGQR